MTDYTDLIAKLRVYPIAGKRPPIHAALRNEAADALAAQATELDSWTEYCHASDFDAKVQECERLRELAMEARDFLAEHELNVFGAGANLFTKLCAALKEQP